MDIKYNRKFATSDVYQLFLYAYVLGADAASRQAGLIYPAISAASGPNLSINPVSGPTAARITGAALDVPKALDAVNGPDERSFMPSCGPRSGASLVSDENSYVRDRHIGEPARAPAPGPPLLRHVARTDHQPVRCGLRRCSRLPRESDTHVRSTDSAGPAAHPLDDRKSVTNR